MLPRPEIIKLMRRAAKNEVLPRFGHVEAHTKETYRAFKESVTDADTKASEFLLRHVRPHYPGSYTEEEFDDSRFSHNTLWQFDPVDGTDEFAQGYINWFAMHGAKLQRQPDGTYHSEQGILYLPGTGELWTGDGKNAQRFQCNVQQSDLGVEQPLPELKRVEVRGYVRAIDPNDTIGTFYEQLGQFLGMPGFAVPSGGAGASFADLLAGRLNLVVMNYDYTKEWDVAMAEPIIRARGGWITDLSGNPFTYNRRDPFNRDGYVASIVFSPDEVLPHITKDLLIRKL